jgi:hypothetical protein
MIGLGKITYGLHGVALTGFPFPISMHPPSLIKHDHHFKGGVSKDNIWRLMLRLNEFIRTQIDAETTKERGHGSSLPLTLAARRQHIHCIPRLIRQLSNVLPFIHLLPSNAWDARDGPEYPILNIHIPHQPRRCFQ